MSETVILCEGYHDRAFWSGLLAYTGCTNLYKGPGTQVRDPFNQVVKGGQFAFHSRTGNFLRVVPCHGKDNVRKIAEARLLTRIKEPLQSLVLNLDADTNADGTPNASKTIGRESILTLLDTLNISRTETPAGTLLIDNGATEICLLRWEANDPPTPGLPNQQTLERLVCAALHAAYPARTACIANWLNTRHEPPDVCVKEYVWSHMAGWYAENGCEDFYRGRWDDVAIARELEARLQAIGVWQVIQTVIQ